MTASFSLLGHVAPAGKYPAVVVPVGIAGERRVAVHQNLHGDLEFVPFAGDGETHPETLVQRLHSFEPTTHALFAFAPDDVVAFPLSERVRFLRSVMHDRRVRAADPFVVYALAWGTQDFEDVQRELLRCLRWLKDGNSLLAASWYEQQRSRIIAAAPHLYDVLPRSWEQVAIPSHAEPVVVDAVQPRLQPILSGMAPHRRSLQDRTPVCSAFLSYERRDARVANAVREFLSGELDVYWEDRSTGGRPDSSAAGDWPSILDRLDRADCVVVILSGRPGRGSYVEKELAWAIDRSKREGRRNSFVIPVLLPGYEPREIPGPLRSMQALSLDSFDEGSFKRLSCRLRDVITELTREPLDRSPRTAPHHDEVLFGHRLYVMANVDLWSPRGREERLLQPAGTVLIPHTHFFSTFPRALELAYEEVLPISSRLGVHDIVNDKLVCKVELRQHHDALIHVRAIKAAVQRYNAGLESSAARTAAFPCRAYGWLSGERIVEYPIQMSLNATHSDERMATDIGSTLRDWSRPERLPLSADLALMILDSLASTSGGADLSDLRLRAEHLQRDFRRSREVRYPCIYLDLGEPKRGRRSEAANAAAVRDVLGRMQGNYDIRRWTIASDSGDRPASRDSVRWVSGLQDPQRPR